MKHFKELKKEIEAIIGCFRIGYPTTYHDKGKRANRLKLIGKSFTEEEKEKLLRIPEIVKVGESKPFNSEKLMGREIIKTNEYWGGTIYYRL